MDQQAFAQLLGNYGEFFGAVAVIATLLYLARQIRLTRQQFQRQVEDGSRSRVFDAYDAIYQEGMMEIFYKGQHTPDELNDYERFVYEMLMGRQVAAMQQIADCVETGVMSGDTGAGYARFFQQTLFDMPGGSRFLESNSYVQEMLDRMRTGVGPGR